PSGPDHHILALAAAALQFLEGDESTDNEAHYLRKELNWNDLYNLLGELHRREAEVKARLTLHAQELSGVEQHRTLLEGMLKKLLKQPPLPDTLREWAKSQFTDEEVKARLREIRAIGGSELPEFLGDLEQVVHG